MGRANIFIVSGPSGSGKTSVVEHLLQRVPNLVFSVSATTRSPRGSERDGREYHFVSAQEFQQMIERGEFLEHADVFGDLYGTPRQSLTDAERDGKDLLLDIDIQGAKQLKNRRPEAVAVLLLPPSWEEMERRLRGRGLDAPDVMRRRLARARQEIESYQTYDYVVINRELAETCSQVEAILITEQRRRAGQALSTPALQELATRAAAAQMEVNRSRISAILDTFGEKAP